MFVQPGSVVRTDGWNGYLPLSSQKYVHKVIRKIADIGYNLLPLVDCVASLLKRWLTGTQQGAVRMSHLDYYLDEYTFRFNRRTSRSRGKLFYSLVEQAVALEPITGLKHWVVPAIAVIPRCSGWLSDSDNHKIVFD